MNKKILREFGKNGLEILQWSILLLLYEKDRQMTHREIREYLDLPTSNHPPPGGAAPNAFVREILRSSREKYGHVEYVGHQTWQLTDKGRGFVENGLDS